MTKPARRRHPSYRFNPFPIPKSDPANFLLAADEQHQNSASHQHANLSFDVDVNFLDMWQNLPNQNSEPAGVSGSSLFQSSYMGDSGTFYPKHWRASDALFPANDHKMGVAPEIFNSTFLSNNLPPLGTLSPELQASCYYRNVNSITNSQILGAPLPFPLLSHGEQSSKQPLSTVSDEQSQGPRDGDTQKFQPPSAEVSQNRAIDSARNADQEHSQTASAIPELRPSEGEEYYRKIKLLRSKIDDQYNDPGTYLLKKIDIFCNRIQDRYDALPTYLLKKIDIFLEGEEEEQEEEQEEEEVCTIFEIHEQESKSLEAIDTILQNEYKNNPIQVKSCNSLFFEYFRYSSGGDKVKRSDGVTEALVDQESLTQLQESLKSEGSSWMLAKCGYKLVAAAGVLDLSLASIVTVLVLAGLQAVITLPMAAMISLVAVAGILALPTLSTTAVAALRYRFFAQERAVKQEFLELVEPLSRVSATSA